MFTKSNRASLGASTPRHGIPVTRSDRKSKRIMRSGSHSHPSWRRVCLFSAKVYLNTDRPLLVRIRHPAVTCRTPASHGRSI